MSTQPRSSAGRLGQRQRSGRVAVSARSEQYERRLKRTAQSDKRLGGGRSGREVVALATVHPRTDVAGQPCVGRGDSWGCQRREAASTADGGCGFYHTPAPMGVPPSRAAEAWVGRIGRHHRATSRGSGSWLGVSATRAARARAGGVGQRWRGLGGVLPSRTIGVRASRVGRHCHDRRRTS